MIKTTVRESRVEITDTSNANHVYLNVMDAIELHNILHDALPTMVEKYRRYLGDEMLKMQRDIDIINEKVFSAKGQWTPPGRYLFLWYDGKTVIQPSVTPQDLASADTPDHLEIVDLYKQMRYANGEWVAIPEVR